MKKILISLTGLALIVIALAAILLPRDRDAAPLSELHEKYAHKRPPGADHAQFAQLRRSFTSPHEVTAACITCHNQRHTEVMQSNHWNWEREEYIQGRGVVYIGKRNAVNNFCIAALGNEMSCAKCHIGFGIDAQGHGMTDSTNIDCLVCHDNTEAYLKGKDMGGAPDPKVDLGNIARHVGRPKRSNCGVCHFFGGGGNNVKHGDLDQAQFEPDRTIDVHMATDGANLVCVDCHVTERHMISGKLYSLSSMNHNRVTCEQCHGEMPHENSILNEHTVKVACQTCHIPAYAKGAATKLSWDWSTAGQLREGRPYEVDDKDGNHTYLSIKGSFVWGRNVRPEYQWFNGTASHYLIGDVVKDTSLPLVLNTLHGSYANEDSKITPVKVHRARQPFDPVNRMVIIPKLFSAHEGDGGFWKDFSWLRASEEGMKVAGLPFSGQVAFIRTEMNWPINHQVAPKEQALQCADCHSRTNSRLAGLTDFYMPGRDYAPTVETGGTILIVLTLLGVFIHGALRIRAGLKANKE